MTRGLRFLTDNDLPEGLRRRIAEKDRPVGKRADRKPRKPSKDEEHTEQVVFFNRIRTLAMNDARYSPAVRSTHAIPNGGGRTLSEGRRLKAEGVTPGVSDIFCRLPAPGYHGLYIEMKKRKGGRVSEAQREWIAESIELGYQACVCHGADDAFVVWRGYVDGYLADTSEPMR